MSSAYIEKELDKIVASSEFPQNMALASAWVIAHFKGINIKIYDVKESSSLCDYNIIASAENTTQARSMVDEIVRNLRKHEVEILSLEGMAEADWILLDMGDIIVHIFQDLSRDIFDLDSLWHKYEQLPIPQEFYFGEPSEEKANKDSSENYF
ncbi:MAG: ribosome silencing factor [Bacteriovoracaceae bacterium]|jgi:ribosome-associated protein|nr:ribosome silencing factor [Bacteriovoracaceae bacterium]|tara:strand:+ start:365 stop:823 length:459 start_codon:yes stop_codon:yes gene_type:complete